MENKKSTTTKIDQPRKWDGPNGTVFYFPIEFADGTRGTFSTKEEQQKKFTLGKETEYTVESVVKGDKTDIKINIPQQAGAGFKGRPFDPEADKLKNKLIIRQVSLNAAVEFCKSSTTKLNSKEVLQLADKFNEWIISPFKDKL